MTSLVADFVVLLDWWEASPQDRDAAQELMDEVVAQMTEEEITQANLAWFYTVSDKIDADIDRIRLGR